MVVHTRDDQHTCGQRCSFRVPRPPQNIKLWIMPPIGVRILPGLGASFAILTLGLIPIWLPAPDLLIDEEAMNMCFAHQVQTAGVNNPSKFPSVSCEAGWWTGAFLGASLSRPRSQAYLKLILATNSYAKGQNALNAFRGIDLFLSASSSNSSSPTTASFSPPFQNYVQCAELCVELCSSSFTLLNLF